MLTLTEISARVANYKPDLLDLSQDTRQAAVAIVVQQTDAGIALLFIKRAEHEDDPWSGHMSFPGGHRDQADTCLRSAAERETFEEIGLQLTADQCCGALSHQRTFGRGNRPGMPVAPYVYINERTFEPRLSAEVEAIVWGPLEDMMNGGLYGTEERGTGSQRARFDGYKLGRDRFVWGLTYRTLQGFFKVLDPTYIEPSAVG